MRRSSQASHRRMRQAASAAALAILCGAGGMWVAPALAAPGGVSNSGGSMPSGRQIDAQKRYADGVAAMQAGEFKGAVSAFNDVLRVSPKNGQVSYLLGLAQVGQEKWKDARKSLTNAVKYSPDLAEAKSWLGVALVKTGEAAKAAEQRAELQAMKDKCAGACSSAAAIDAGLKRIDDVVANPAMKFTSRDEARRFASADAAGGAYLAAYGLINEGKYDAALGLLRKAALAKGPSADVLTYQGFANRKLRRYDAALSYYTSALEIDPQHRGVNEYLGEYYVETGDMARARTQLAKLEAMCKFGCPEAEELRVWIARGHA